MSVWLGFCFKLMTRFPPNYPEADLRLEIKLFEKLAKLADTEDDTLRAKLAEAIANCCEWPGNRALFGQSGAVAPLVSYLASNDLEVHRTTSVALFQLSKDPWNCVTMHQHGVVGHLLRLIG